MICRSIIDQVQEFFQRSFGTWRCSNTEHKFTNGTIVIISEILRARKGRMMFSKKVYSSIDLRHIKLLK